MKTTISMSELLVLKARCEAISSEGLFGFNTDLKISALGARARKAIEYTIGKDLDRIAGKKEQITNKHRAAFKGLPETEQTNKDFKKAVLSDQEYNDLTEEEVKLWDKTMNDFEAEPIKISVPDGLSDKIKERKQIKTWRGLTSEIDVYGSILALLSEDEGYLVVEG